MPDGAESWTVLDSDGEVVAHWDPEKPIAYASFLKAFSEWQHVIALHDTSGRPLHVVPHQLRHSAVITPPVLA